MAIDSGRFGHFAVFSVIGTIALMPLLVLPAMIGVLVDQAGLTDTAAGWSAALNFTGSAAIGMWLSLRMHHLSLRRVATVALAAAVLLDLASAAAAGPGWTFFAARLFAGAALGAAYICSATAFARFDDYERGYGLFVTLQFIVSGIGLYAVPVFSGTLGASGLFLVFAGLDALALLLARDLPGTRAVAPDAAPRSELHVLVTLGALTGIAGFALFEAANNAQFTYIERFAVAEGYAAHSIGIALLCASLAGIPGAFTIVLLGQRFGTLAPLALGIAVSVTGLALLILADGYPWYVASCCCMGFAWAFCLPYIQSLLASLDRNGSVIAAGTSASTLGSAIGPGLAALAVTGAGYVGVFLMAIAMFALAISSFAVSARHRRQAREILV